MCALMDEGGGVLNDPKYNWLQDTSAPGIPVAPPSSQGACIWYTGLSGAGKSTSAEVLHRVLVLRGRRVSVLDGDTVRMHLSRGLGFSKEDRDINVRRIGFVAAELVRHGALVLVAAISPYRAVREEVRRMFEAGRFLEVFVATSLEVCERRDPKAMYRQARRGEIKGFTGIDDPYECPICPEITLDTLAHTAEENAHTVLRELELRGFVHRGGIDRAPDFATAGARRARTRTGERPRRRQQEQGCPVPNERRVAELEASAKSAKD